MFSLSALLGDHRSPEPQIWSFDANQNFWINCRVDLRRNVAHVTSFPLWRHQVETFSALLAICARNSPVVGEFPAQRPVTRSLDVFFYLRLNKRLSRQSWSWWFETPSCPLWRHSNVNAKETRVDILLDLLQTNVRSIVVNTVYGRSLYMCIHVIDMQIIYVLNSINVLRVLLNDFMIIFGIVRPSQNAFCKWQFFIIFFVWKLLDFDSYFTESCSYGDI